MKQKMNPSSGILVGIPGQEIKAEKGHEMSGFGYKLYNGLMTEKVNGPGQRS